MLRTSSYAIFVDLPEEPDHMLLVHGYTGAYDRISQNVANYLLSLDSGRLKKPLYGEWSPEAKSNGRSKSNGKSNGAPVRTPSDKTIEVLQKRGYLTEMSPEDEQEFLVQMASKLHHVMMRMQPNYIIMVNYNCNLRCPYCFQDHMRTDPNYQHLLRRMTPEMVDKVAGAMKQVEAGYGIPEDAELPRRLTFYGGEPLLASNHDIIKYFMEKMWSMGPARFSSISNGTDLHHHKDLLGPGKIESIQITLDGPPDEHDKRRIYADGSGSWERIAPNIHMALDLGTLISIRMNIDRNNVDQLPELADVIMAEGWHEHPNFSVYTSPIRAANEQTSVKTIMSSWQLDKKINEMREVFPSMSIIGRPDDGLTAQVRQIFDNRHDPLPRFRTSFCGAHSTMYIFDAFGDIYACWERTGEPEIRIGYIADDGEVLMNAGLTQMWRQRTVASNPICAKCSYAFYCGGGCAILALETSGDMYSNFCDGYAKRFKAAVVEAYSNHLEGHHAMENRRLVCGT